MNTSVRDNIILALCCNNAVLVLKCAVVLLVFFARDHRTYLDIVETIMDAGEEIVNAITPNRMRFL